jgi:phosphoserine aminotransferase
MYNTPATFSWYVAGCVFEWIKEQGGLNVMAKINQTKAQTLYRAIDNSDFYSNPVASKYRSWMNVPFLLADDKLNELFLERSADANLLTPRVIEASVVCVRVSTMQCHKRVLMHW